MNNIKTSFQDGCNTIYDAIVSRGITPEDKSPDNMAYAIRNLLERKIYSVTFIVTVQGVASNGAGSVIATGTTTYVLKSDGTLTNSGLTSTHTSAVAYISWCKISYITLSNLNYNETLDDVTFTISTNATSATNSTVNSPGSQSFRISNKTNVSAISSLSKTSASATQISITLSSISIRVV